MSLFMGSKLHWETPESQTGRFADQLENQDGKLLLPNRILRQARGFTLLEALVLVVVMVILFLSLYTGIVYAEKTLATNYRDRVVTLLLAGELEMEYYRHTRGYPFQLQNAQEYVIQEFERGRVLKGRLTVSAQSGIETSNQRPLNFVALTATMTWVDPITKQPRVLRMREDYF